MGYGKIQIKSPLFGKATVTMKDLDGLIALKEEKKLKKYFLIYTGAEPRKFDQANKIEILSYITFLEKLWSNDL